MIEKSECLSVLQRKAYLGRCLVVVKSDSKQGIIKLIACAAHMATATLSIVSSTGLTAKSSPAYRYPRQEVKSHEKK